MSNNLASIYVATNKLNGKQYVGQTIVSIKERLKNHKSCKRSILGKAIRKYGLDNFYVVEFKDYPLEVIDILEQDFIRLLNTQVPNGYNIMGGGQHTKIGCKQSEEWIRKRIRVGWKMTDEQRKYLSEVKTGKPNYKARGKKLFIEHRKIISDRMTGNIPWNLGIPMAEETKIKAIAKLKGRIAPNKRKIVCIETGEIFDSVRLACINIRGTNKGEANICACAKGKLKSAYGFHWKFIDKLFEEDK